MVQQGYTYAVGRRKSAVAEIRLYEDSGPIVVGERIMEEAFPYSIWQQIINEPFTTILSLSPANFYIKLKLNLCKGCSQNKKLSKS